MDEQLIMNMVKQHVNDGTIKYKTFASLFYMLNDEEKDEVEQILKTNGIKVMLEEDFLPIPEDESNSTLFDEDLFKNSTFDR